MCRRPITIVESLPRYSIVLCTGLVIWIVQLYVADKLTGTLVGLHVFTNREIHERKLVFSTCVRACVSTNQKVVLNTCLVMWTTQLVFTSISAEVCKMFVLLSQHDSVATVGNADTKLGICVLGSKL